jgi:16S rRNA (guanine1207-N2)-methyltransferase
MAEMSGEHYFSVSPTVPARPTEVSFEVGGHTLRLAASAGVFSSGRLDPGTAVLLRKARLPDASATGALLDLGCGYGPIACTLALAAPRCRVYAVDVNVRALELVRGNAARVGAGDRLVAATPDDVPVEVQFREIWSNPPIRIGKDELRALLDRWLARLAPDGVAWLVAGRHLGGDSLAVWLAGQGWAVERQASQKGFRVLRVARPAGRDAEGNSGDSAAPTGENS